MHGIDYLFEYELYSIIEPRAVIIVLYYGGLINSQSAHIHKHLLSKTSRRYCLVVTKEIYIIYYTNIKSLWSLYT